MFMILFTLLMTFILFLSSFMAISASTWFNAWVGLELNLLSFIPLIVLSKDLYSTEAALKYFLIQALASSLIIFSSSILLFSSSLSFIIIAFSLLLKMGASPFHFWFTQIVGGLNWFQSIILMTIQKLAPIFLLSYLINNFFIIYIILTSSMLSAIISSVVGLNQTSLRKIMAFSSINHLAWMLLSMTISDKILFLYFIFYVFISTSIMLLFSLQQAYYLNHLINQKNMSNGFKILLYMSILSLGGLPPFLGFIPKWILLQEMVYLNHFIPLIVLLATTLVVLYFYLRMIFSMLMFSSSQMKHSLMNIKFMLGVVPVLLFMNLFGLLIPNFFLMIL
uniref:NADH-ubiquinone oxidoreductase chain 2 n=1 Tax=Gastroptychus investigatoris TaxID=2020971 RepID=A0A3Q8BT10_9EUCA|nr:NADH dehydrogenase subunit 2 [Gastroptychus investigatoris]